MQGRDVSSSECRIGRPAVVQRLQTRLAMKKKRSSAKLSLKSETVHTLTDPEQEYTRRLLGDTPQIPDFDTGPAR